VGGLELLRRGFPSENHGLYLLECESFDEVPSNLEIGPYFVSFLVADFSTINRDDLVRLTGRMIARGSRYFVAWGKDSNAAHVAFDLACCEFEDGEEEDAVILTTDHLDESIEEAIWFAMNCAFPSHPYDRNCVGLVAICIHDPGSAKVVRSAFESPDEFSDKFASE
jgi:hypothetical protein